jgi:hypothetical protein
MNLYQPTITGSLAVSGSVGISGSLTVNGGTISGTSSLATTASYAVTATSASYAVNASNALSASNASAAATASYVLNAVSASYANNASAAVNSTLFNSTASSVFATTGSNTLTGVQYVSNTNDAIAFSNTTSSIYTDGGLQVTKDAYLSSSLYIKGNLTVYGTQSVSFITSSQLNISTNLITVNTNTPSVRFGGLAVYDSGSTGLTGSILWDSQGNHWIYSNPSGSSYSGGMFISGPRNTGSLGDEQGTTLNAIMKGQGGDHITSSIMFESASLVGIGTSSPSYKLDVVGTAGNIARITDGTSHITFYAGSGLNEIATVSPLLLTVSGSERMRITSAGNVGIGYTNPTVRLQVSGTIATGNDNNGWGRLSFDTASNTTRLQSAKNGTDSVGLSFWTQESGGGFAERMTISGSDVGIGTTNPGRTLHILGQSGIGTVLKLEGASGTTTYLQLAYNGATNAQSGYIGYDSSANMPFFISNTERMRITSGGYFKASNTGDYSWTSATNPHHDIFSNNVSNTTLHVASTSNDYSGTTLALGVLRSANSAYNLLAAYSGNGTTPFSSLRFIVRGDGYVGMGTTDFSTQNGNVGNIFKIVSNNNNVIIGETSTTARSLILEGRRTSRSGGARNVQLILGGDSNDNGYFSFQTADTGAGVSERLQITATGVVQPGANGTQDLGTSSLRWGTIYTSDLSLSNGIGDYTIVEGENDLFLYNNKQNKVYKFMLAEVDPADATPKKS